MKISRLLIMASLALGPPALAQKQPVFSDADRMDLALTLAKLIGMSPTGTQLYAEEALKGSRAISYREIEEADLALSQELEQDAPDERKLAALTERVARAAAAINAQRSRAFIATAQKLAPADRKILARYKISELRESLAKQRSVTVILPATMP